ncbi:MAG: hypothetical protein KDD94_09090, partial [Calditrichaeota bacterium]|nr:hypothetical protein [Calditrichota bacterium]
MMCLRGFFLLTFISLFISGCIEKRESGAVKNTREFSAEQLKLNDKNYRQLWSIVDSLRSFREEQSAYLVSQFILQKSFREKETEHAIHALTSLLSSQLSLSADNEQLIIEQTELIADSASGIIQALLFSMSAELNYRYYFRNEALIKNKSGDLQNDRSEWGRESYIQHIDGL